MMIRFKFGIDQADCVQRLKSIVPTCGDLAVEGLKTCVSDFYAQACDGDHDPASCQGYFDCA
ncbi:MAG: hypothetical protein JW940_13380 [Polyangiaceae bacterium]|nr:hypothetical protein [Polyangiaceae bacterium]